MLSATAAMGQAYVSSGLQTSDIMHPLSWPMGTSSLASGDTYSGGFYILGGTANDFNPAVNFGTANGSYAAHFMVVAAAGATDCVITIQGTSITDAGVETPGDSQTISLISGDADVYYETPEKWVGQITVTKTAGTDRLMNYGLCKYWDNMNTDFTVYAFEAVWEAAKTDSGFDVNIIHHGADGWTYNAASEPGLPYINRMSLVHTTARSSIAGEHGAFKVTSAGVPIIGSGSEGLVFSVTTTSTNVLEYGSIQIWYTE